MFRSFSFYSLKNKIQVFYVLALVPLPIMTFFSLRSGTFEVVIALYGLILLYLKKPRLSSQPKADSIQSYLGFVVIASSFFLYFALSPFIRYLAYYGAANYAMYIVGLFLVFFRLSALREAFSPLFLIVASSSISFMSTWLGAYLSSYIPYYVRFIELIFRALGVNVTARYPNVISFQTASGNVDVPIAWECVGAYSALVFSIILVVLMSEEQAEIKTKISWSVVGIVGTFIVNIIRILLILLAYRDYGYELAWIIHNYIGGYFLFFAWLLFFFYMFSKRQVISGTARSLWKKLRYAAAHSGI